MKNIFIGIAFASLWSSASVATKIGLSSAEPLMIANARFFIAGILMLLWAHIGRRHRLPLKTEWLPLAIYGFLNVTLYLGAFVYAMKHVTAGIGSLSVATNPIFISILTALWLRKPIKTRIWAALGLGILGVGVATYPLLRNSYADTEGLIILTISMLSYSVGTVYYSSRQWAIPTVVINGWQVLLGGFLLLPLTYFMTDMPKNTFDAPYWLSVMWLAVPVSIGAVQLWLYLLKLDAVKAAMWLFLCPISGFIYAFFILGEPITAYTIVGTAFVIWGLYLGQKKQTAE